MSDASAVAHAKIDSDAATADSALITAQVNAAIRWCERYCNRAFIDQTITLWLDADEMNEPFHLPRPPLDSITSFHVYDEDDTETEVTSTYYRVLGSDPAKIEQKGDGWTLDRDDFAAKIVYKAGYGTASTDVPEEIAAAIKIVFTDLYENRQDFVTEELPNLGQAKALLEYYRMGHVTSWT